MTTRDYIRTIRYIVREGMKHRREQTVIDRHQQRSYERIARDTVCASRFSSVSRNRPFDQEID